MKTKHKMPYTVYIPTIGYELGKPTTDLKEIIKFAINARRNETNQDMIDYYNTILTDAYNVKYDNL